MTKPKIGYCAATTFKSDPQKTLVLCFVLLLSALLVTTLLINNVQAADKRVALIIGNSDYENVSILTNPKNDAQDMATALDAIGFDVTKIENATFSAMRNALRKFSKKARGADVAMVYFAGHGMEVDRQNYLIPTDAVLASDQDIEYEAIPIDLLNRSVSGAKGLSMILLDACRNNPFANKMKSEKSSRSIGRGLAPVEPNLGSLVSYAAREGTTADDGGGRNSPYTKALLMHIQEPGVDIRRVFDKVRDSVIDATGGVQQPFVYSSLPGRDVFLNGPAETSTNGNQNKSNAIPPTLEIRMTVEIEYWNSVKDSGSVELLQSYIDQYPSGSFAVIAKHKVKQLNKQDEQQVAAIAAPLPKKADLYKPKTLSGVSEVEIRTVQSILDDKGYDVGSVDGQMGQKTTQAIKNYQSDWQIPQTGNITGELLDRLQRNHPSTKPQLVQAQNSDCAIFDTTPEARTALIVTGSCSDGKIVGRGELNWTYMRHGKFVTSDYSGNFVNGKLSGYGRRKFRSGSIYEGEFINGSRDGRGKYTYASGDVYEGQYRNGNRHGQGVYTYQSGSVFEGEYVNGKRDGQGTYNYASGSIYIGQYKDGEKHGLGIYTFKSGNFYDGEFRNGKPNGKGTYTKIGGKTRIGQWNNGCYKNGNDWAVVLSTSAKCGFK